MSSRRFSVHAVELLPVDRQTLASAVIDRLVAYIEAKELGPGDMLPAQLELSRQLGVSRPVLREALQGLASLEIVEIRPGSGVYVRDHGKRYERDGLIEVATHEMALEVLEARKVIEVEMAGLAASRATDDDFRRMDAVLAKLKRACARKQPTAKTMADFHRVIARASHNTMLYRMNEMLSKANVAQGERVERALPDTSASQYESHLRLREAIASRDPDIARQEMRRHLEIAHGWEEQLLHTRHGDKATTSYEFENNGGQV